MNRTSVLLAAATLTAGFSTAQGTVTNNNVAYTVGTISAAQADSVDSNFTCNAGVDTDVMWEHWWYYRANSDTQESPLKNDGTLTQNYAGSHADLDWSDIDQRNLISGNLDVDAISTGPTSGVAVFRFRITNISGAPLRLAFFNYADLDLCTAGNNVAGGTGERQAITNPGICATEALEFFGADISQWEVGPYSSGELGLTDGAPTNLPSSGLPFAGDYTGAIQWNHSFDPGETKTFVSVLSHNDRSCVATFSPYGSAYPGSTGLPNIISGGLPLAGTTVRVGASGFSPGAPAALIIGALPANIPILGMTLLVDPRTSFGISSTIAANGFARLAVAIPPNLCGTFVYFQWFALDRGAPNGLASHSQGLHWRVGNY